MTSRQWHFFCCCWVAFFRLCVGCCCWFCRLPTTQIDASLAASAQEMEPNEQKKRQRQTKNESERERESVGAAVIFGVTHWNWEIIAQVLSIIRLIRLRWWADRFASVGASTRAEGFRPNIRELMFVIRWNSMRSFKWFGWLGWMNWIRSNYQANIAMIHSYPIQLDLKSSIWPCFKQRHCPTV